MSDIKMDGQGKMFENPILDWLSKTHISIPLIIFYGSSLAILLYITLGIQLSPMKVLLLFVAGFIFFTLVEYFGHRYAYHIVPNTAFKKKLQYKLHGLHHEYPKDKKRLAMPPIIAIVVAFLFLSFYKLIMGNFGFAFGAGFMSGYSTYLIIHYIIHARKPPKNFLRSLWINHNIHHFKNQKVAFGVSSPLWDFVFGTMPEKKQKERKVVEIH